MSLSCLRCVLLDLRSRGWGVERRTRPDHEQKLIDAEMDGVGGAETCQLCCGRMDRDSEGSFFPLQLPSHSSLLLFFLLSSGPHVLVHHSFLGSSVTLCYHLPGRGGTQVFLFCFAPKLTSLFIIILLLTWNDFLKKTNLKPMNRPIYYYHEQLNCSSDTPRGKEWMNRFQSLYFSFHMGLV